MRRVLTACLLVAFSTPMRADDVYVPDNQANAGSKNLIPFSPSIMKTNCRYQALYLAAKLPGQGFVIKDIAFATSWTGDLKATQMQVRISHYAASTLVATMDQNIPSPVTVFNGPITWMTTVDTWSPMGLIGTFLWNGKDNFVVDIRYQGGTVSGNGSLGAGRVTSGAIPRNWAMGNYNAVMRTGTDKTGGLKTRFTVDFAAITLSGKPSPGGTVTLQLNAPGDGGLAYQVGNSLGTGPIPIDTRRLDLSPDNLLVTSVGGSLPLIFANYTGVLDGNGQAQARLNIPPLPALVGIRVHSAFLTIQAAAPSNIRSISKTASFSITT